MTDETNWSDPDVAELGADEVEISSVRWYRRIKDWLWGYDFFVSYHWASGGTYAVDLAAQLREKGYEVFLDRAEYAMGDKWKGVGEVALRNTQRLVLVATREAVFESQPVAREVVLFTNRNRQCIPIYFGDTFADEEQANPGKFVVLERLADDTLHIQDAIENLPVGPASEVVENLAAGHGIMRRRKLRTTITVAAISMLSTFLLFAVIAGFVARSQRNIAIKERNESEARRLATVATANAAERTDLAILLALESLKTTETDEGWEALFTALSRPVLARSPLVGHKAGVNRVLFSPDGSVLASMGGDGIVGLWDSSNPAAMRQIHKLEGHAADGNVWEAAFSPNGSMLATPGSDWTVCLWAVDTGEQLGEPLKGHFGVVWDVAFSPDGKLLATASSDSTVRLWDLQRREQIDMESMGTEEQGIEVWEVSFSADGSRLLWVSSDGSLRSRLAAPGSEVEVLLTGREEWSKGSTAPGIAFSHDAAKLAVASGDWTVQVWDLVSDDPTLQSLVGHDGFVVDLAFSKDNTRLASAGQDRSVRVWDVAAGAQVGGALTGHDAEVFSVGFSPDGKLLASGSADQSVRLWDMGAGESVGSQLDHGDWVLGLAVSPDGSLAAAAGEDSKISLWDVASGRLLLDIPGSHGSAGVNSVAFSPDAKLLASTGNDETVRLWNVDSGRPASEPLAGHGDWVRVARFSPNGKLLASASDDGNVGLWDPVLGKLVRTLECHDDLVLALAFSSDGTVLASASSDKSVRLWEVGTGRQRGKALAIHDDAVLDVCFVPAGTHLLSVSRDGVVLRCDLLTRDAEEVLDAETEWTAATFSDDASMLASAAPDGSARLWELESGTQKGVALLGHATTVERLDFSRCGSFVVSASESGTVRLWPAQSQWRALASARVGRNLSAAEWNRFVDAKRPYQRQSADHEPADAPGP